MTNSAVKKAMSTSALPIFAVSKPPAHFSNGPPKKMHLSPCFQFLCAQYHSSSHQVKAKMSDREHCKMRSEGALTANLQ